MSEIAHHKSLSFYHIIFKKIVFNNSSGTLFNTKCLISVTLIKNNQYMFLIPSLTYSIAVL